MLQEVCIRDERLCLLPERAIWWASQKAIILSDVHWGKTAHFRKSGIAMPVGTQEQDALRLAKIIRDFGAEQLIIAGDLFHSRHNNEVENFRHWRDAHQSLNIHFVMGNHDILPEKFYESLHLKIYREGMHIHPFYIVHDAIPPAPEFVMHGHLHPGLSMTGLGMSARSLPCFCITADKLILPAFGKFTGCKRIKPEEFREVYVVGEQKVLRVK